MLDLSLRNDLILNEELDVALQELDILFNTTATELIGDTDYGVNFEQFLWQMTPSPEQLRTYIIDKISNCTLYLSRANYNIVVSTIPGIYRDIYNVEITVDTGDTDDAVTRVYQIR